MTERRFDWGAPTVDPLDQALADDRQSRAGAALVTAHPNPDEAARANVLARQTGLPPETVQRTLGQTQLDQQRAKAIGDVSRASPYVQQWYSNPRNAAAAQDDTQALGRIGDHADFYRRMSQGQSISASKPAPLSTGSFFSGLWEAAKAGVVGLEVAGDDFLRWAGVTAPQRAGTPRVSDTNRNQVRAARSQARVDAASPQFNSSIASGAYSGVQSLVQQAPGIIASAMTGTSVPALAYAAGSTAAQAYTKYRGRGGTPTEAAVGAAGEGAVEWATELIPMHKLIGALGEEGAKRVFTGILKSTAADIPGEQIATLAQDAIDTAIANPDKTWGDYFAERPSAALNTLVATVTQGGITAGLGASARHVADRFGASADAMAVQQLMSDAEGSKLRERDPEAFRKFIAGQTENTPVENVYIPAEAIRELMQDGYRDHDFFGDYADQIDEALALDGDVVLPTADVAARLAGTDEWRALQQEARFSPGGMSQAELASLETTHREHLEMMGSRIAEQAANAEEAAKPATQVYSQVRDQLTNAGFAPDAADKYAQLWAANRESWAARLGTDALSYHEANPIEFRRVLPEALSKVQAADGVDIVINAMKRGTATAENKGPSLLEWIAKRGGIEDRGGDIASMGGADWHKAKRFRKKLIRPHEDAGQGSMLGPAGAGVGDQHGLGTTLAAAIEAGFFPELRRDTENPDGGTYADKADTDALLAAIGEEIAGRPRHALDPVRQEADAQVQAAADDLRQLLEGRGLDPDNATNAEIKEAINGFRQEAQNEGDLRELEQISPEQAMETNVSVEMPADPLFAEAVANTPGAEITVDGLRITLVRAQKEEQEGAYSVRTGVFYLPKGAADLRHYKKGGEPGSWYGGQQVHEGETLIRRPLFVKGATGGKAPEAAFDAIQGKGAMKKLDEEIRSFIHSRAALNRIDPGVWEETVDKFLTEHGVENLTAYDVHAVSQKGNQLNYALRELVVAHAIRDAGYDAMVGYSKGKDGAKISEVFDVREQTYPSRIGESEIHGRYFEQNKGGVRGVMKFAPGRVPVIELFEKADLSTVIHETGHVWLEELKLNATREGASADVVADWETIKAWFADQGHPVGDDGFIPTDAHEVWSRGFERYALEGKAPSSALRKAFDAMRGWLLTIYKHVNNLRAPITPEVRAVFDRMLATQDAIDEEAQRQNIRMSFDRTQLGMTEAEYAALQQAAGDARSEAFDALLYRTMATIRRERTKAWKDEERTVRDNVAASVDAQPEFRAIQLLRTGRWLGEPDREAVKVKLDREWLIREYGSDALSLLPKGVPPIYKEGGDDADTVAEMVGFRTGDEMVRAMMGVEAAQLQLREAGDKRSVRQRMIDDRTQATMRERHGDPLSDGSIEEEALAAIHNDRQGEVFAAEARALARQRGDVPTPYRVARDWAARKVAEGKVVDVASRAALQRYARAAAKAGRSAEAAVRDGDIDEAFRQKQAQMLNHALIAEAKKVADAVDAAVERLGKIAKRATMKTVDQEYLDRAHDLLEKFDFRPRSQRAVDEQQSFAAWAAEQQANGVDVAWPPRLEDKGTHYTRMSVEELMGLDASVRQVIHLGRVKQELLDAKDERDFDEVVGEALMTMSELRQRDPNNNMAATIADKVRSNIASADASLLKMETVFDWLDNGNPNGVFNRVVFRRIAEAQGREREMMGDYVRRIQALLVALPKETVKRWSERVVIPEFLNRETGEPWNMTRDQLIAVALNVGNEGNLDKLARGYGWSPDGIMAALERELNPGEWQFVQSMWDTIGTLWPEIAGLEKRVNGVEPEKVAAREFWVGTGKDAVKLAGGYYPVVYDTSKSLGFEEKAGASDALFQNIYTRANTTAGATKERTAAAYPVLLSLGVVNRHIAEVIHDVTHREAVMDADRFLSSRRVKEAVRSALGPEVQKQFRPWLQHIANEWAIDRRGVEGWDKLAKTLRTHSTIIGMGYRLTTILAQLGGYANSTEQIGARWMASGFRAATGTPAKMAASFDFVMERSTEVRHRMDTLERDINANVRELQGKHGTLANVRRFAFHGIGYMDRVVVIPTWMGAFNKAQSEGMSETDAAYYADKIVRNSQGAGAAKDLASIQRGGEWMKLATMFYSYANTFYNRQRSIARDVGDAVAARRTSDFPALLARSWWLFAVSPMLAALPGVLLGNGGPDKDEDWGMWGFQNMLAGLFLGVPVARDIAGSLASGFDYSFTPASRAIETTIKSAKDLKKLGDMDPDTHPSERAVKNAVEATGYVTRLPVGQISNAAQFITDWANGDADPKTVGDWLHGLQTGKVEDEGDRR